SGGFGDAVSSSMRPSGETSTTRAASANRGALSTNETSTGSSVASWPRTSMVVAHNAVPASSTTASTYGPPAKGSPVSPSAAPCTRAVSRSRSTARSRRPSNVPGTTWPEINQSPASGSGSGGAAVGSLLGLGASWQKSTPPSGSAQSKAGTPPDDAGG